jgi:septin family protein
MERGSISKRSQVLMTVPIKKIQKIRNFTLLKNFLIMKKLHLLIEATSDVGFVQFCSEKAEEDTIVEK